MHHVIQRVETGKPRATHVEKEFINHYSSFFILRSSNYQVRIPWLVENCTAKLLRIGPLGPVCHSLALHWLRVQVDGKWN